MIIWRGMGVLALVVAIALNVLVNESANNLFGIPDGFKHYRDAHKYVVCRYGPVSYCLLVLGALA